VKAEGVPMRKGPDKKSTSTSTQHFLEVLVRSIRQEKEIKYSKGKRNMVYLQLT
jgi:hypothetical protein